MITKNFRGLLKALTYGPNTGCYYINRNNEDTSSNVNSGGVITYNYRMVIVGKNDTEPTINDYDLDTITDLTFVNSTTIPNTSGPQYAKYATDGSYTTTIYTNNTNEPITVKEVGLITTLSNTANSSAITNKENTALLARETITPITIQPNETVSFTIKFT